MCLLCCSVHFASVMVVLTYSMLCVCLTLCRLRKYLCFYFVIALTLYWLGDSNGIQPGLKGFCQKVEKTVLPW